jgi:hypothetical protein
VSNFQPRRAGKPGTFSGNKGKAEGERSRRYGVYIAVKFQGDGVGNGKGRAYNVKATCIYCVADDGKRMSGTSLGNECTMNTTYDFFYSSSEVAGTALASQ